ncbi:ubiquinone/menaquinone biosynthesis C-methylase UbiE [Melghiribacillus thermohalophilus]|uniref:Ubiquinone/menaquinone biosynthesis C-methylase UbiE n=1 Tax=Melghiribacillus thermohalophilus TaxID=1324956 RepID=A0A4R3NE19_9BACI|nr:class I SAM-dependent methyltransferase [Melghiribacillus thermohalophilus]TCT25456.1 ubiquinone/menaquinone biosynthesis C-methylase UbiE [Melghiribacillus thermohalophilus]
MTLYNDIGRTYNSTRHADSRITHRLVHGIGINPPATILDIGAGTGNYSYQLADMGYRVVALEPSQVMRTQGKKHKNMTWKEGVAESIPLEDQSVNGIICTLASHHFRNLSSSFSEMASVLKEKGKAVIFTLDPRLCPHDCWLLDYFEPLLKDAYTIHPPVKDLVRLAEEKFGRTAEISPFPLPHDLVDLFFFAGWKNPELYLNEFFQKGTSPLAKGQQEMVSECLNRLRNDLENGNWHKKYGEIIHLNEYDCGHFFLLV